MCWQEQFLEHFRFFNYVALIYSRHCLSTYLTFAPPMEGQSFPFLLYVKLLMTNMLLYFRANINCKSYLWHVLLCFDFLLGWDSIFTMATLFSMTILVLLVSSVRSSDSHPDLLLTQHQHPLFQITPDLNTGLSLSEPRQLYKGNNAIWRKSLDSMCWLNGCLMGSTGHH